MKLVPFSTIFSRLHEKYNIDEATIRAIFNEYSELVIYHTIRGEAVPFTFLGNFYRRMTNAPGASVSTRNNYPKVPKLFFQPHGDAHWRLSIEYDKIKNASKVPENVIFDKIVGGGKKG